jgi:hypothetical protein
MIIDIGGVSIRLTIDNLALEQEIRTRYEGFTESEAQPSFEFTITTSTRPTTYGQQVTLHYDRPTWTAERCDFWAKWDLASHHGQIRQIPFAYASDVILRIFYGLMLLQNGGLVLHAASAVRNGRAFIFTGVSGSGKSTIANLAPPDTKLLSDETSFVNVNGTSSVAFGTPFPGDLDRNGMNIAAPVAGLYFLKKGNRNRIERLAPHRVVDYLLRNVVLYYDQPELRALAFRTGCAFLSTVPVYQLTFVPDARVWDLIA